MRIRSLSVICLIMLAWPAIAAADVRVVVGEFKGPNGKQVRAAVIDVLEEHDVELVPPKKAAATARSSGAELDTESGRVRVAKKLHLRAFIEGHTRPVKRRLQVTVTVFGGGDGMQASEFTTAAAKASVVRDVRAKLWSAISLALSGEAPAPLEPEPAAAARPERSERPGRPAAPVKSPPVRSASADDELPPGVVARSTAADDESESDLAEHAEQEEASENRPSALDLGVGARLGSRAFGYKDSLPGLRPYTLSLGPSIALRARWYPAAHFTAGALAHIGLDLRGEFLVGVSSKNSDGREFSTSSHTIGVGLRVRIPLDKLELGAVGGFGQHSFGFSEASGKIDPDLPDVTYNFVRAGLDARWQFFGPLALQLAAAYLVGLSQGEIAERAWFPHTTGNGFEAEIGLAYPVSRLIALELSFALQRYFLSLNPDPKDPGVVGTGRVAGGALDQYLSTRLGIVFRP
jgi:hypothetical protein